MTLATSTMSGNSANGDFGGAVFNLGTATITACTISGNSAWYGGGISNYGVLNIDASTISGNTAWYGGGTYNHYAIMLTNSIVAGNLPNPNMFDVSGALTPSSAFNLIGVGEGMTGISDSTNGNQVGTVATPIDPRLGPLQDNGGPTKTMALLPGSSAINTGSNALLPTDLVNDQRGSGFPRIVGDLVDIGAFEYQTAPPAPPIADAGGPYVIHEGESLTLSAYASFGYSLTYSWDVNGDGSFTDATSVHPTLSWDQLKSLGINHGPATYNVEVQVDDRFGNETISPAVSLQVLTVTPTATLSNVGSILVGDTVTVQFSDAFDPSPIDTAAGFHYAFATDPATLASATYENSSSTPSAAFTFPTAGRKAIYGRIIAQDNDYGDYSTQFVSYYYPGTLVVVNTDDSGPGSLRDAVDYSSPGTQIVFDDRLRGQTITLTSGELKIAKNDIMIAGPGQDLLTVSGNDNSRVFEITASVTASLSGMTISHGRGDDGGGIYNAGTLVLDGCSVASNAATTSLPHWGGGVYNLGTLTIDASIINGNSGGVEGGGIYNSSGTVTVNASTISGNSGGVSGGGIYNSSGTVTVNASTISGNSANVSGGGIRNEGTLTVTGSTISGNTVSGVVRYGRACCPYTAFPLDWTPGYGGGIDNSGTLTVTDSTIADNSAGSDSVAYPGFNSGKAFGAGINNSGSLTVTNSTLSGNSLNLTGGGNGGGIDNTGTLTATNTIFANGAGGNLLNEKAGVNSGSHNLFSDTPAATLDPTDLINTNPMLGPLADNGGPTFTQALLPGSPAIDAAVAVPGVTTDQRGVPRPQGNAYDIGAFELPLTVHGLRCARRALDHLRHRDSDTVGQHQRRYTDSHRQGRYHS